MILGHDDEAEKLRTSYRFDFTKVYKRLSCLVDGVEHLVHSFDIHPSSGVKGGTVYTHIGNNINLIQSIEMLQIFQTLGLEWLSRRTEKEKILKNLMMREIPRYQPLYCPKEIIRRER